MMVAGRASGPAFSGQSVQKVALSERGVEPSVRAQLPEWSAGIHDLPHLVEVALGETAQNLAREWVAKRRGSGATELRPIGNRPLKRLSLSATIFAVDQTPPPLQPFNI